MSVSACPKDSFGELSKAMGSTNQVWPGSPDIRRNVGDDVVALFSFFFQMNHHLPLAKLRSQRGEFLP